MVERKRPDRGVRCDECKRKYHINHKKNYYIGMDLAIGTGDSTTITTYNVIKGIRKLVDMERKIEEFTPMLPVTRKQAEDLLSREIISIHEFIELSRESVVTTKYGKLLLIKHLQTTC